MEGVVGGVARGPRLTVDGRARCVLVDGEAISLTRTQFDVLNALVSNEGRVMTRAEIMEAVWGHAFFSTPDHLSVHIHHIRRAIGDTEDEPRFIRTVRGVGYMFLPPAEAGQRHVTLTFDRGSNLISVDPHETFLGWDPDQITGDYFSLAGLSIDATEVLITHMLEMMRSVDRIEGPLMARRPDGSTVEVYVSITLSDAHGVGGYTGHVIFDDEPTD